MLHSAPVMKQLQFYIYIYAFSRQFYPKRLRVQFYKCSSVEDNSVINQLNSD